MIIESSKLLVELDTGGVITRLVSKELGIDAVKDKSVREAFRLSVPLPDNWVFNAGGDGLVPAMRLLSESAAEIVWSGIRVDGEEQQISLTAELRLEGDELISRVTIENGSPWRIDYVWYPIIGGVTALRPGEPDSFFRPIGGGSVDPDIHGAGTWGGPRRHWYTSRESIIVNYPAGDMMDWVCLFNASCGIYLSSRDNVDFYTYFVLERECERSPITFSIVKAPFAESGERWVSCENVVSLYRGSWHVAAAKYGRWMGSWMTPKPSPKWVEDLDGWLAFVGHTANRYLHVPYADYPKWVEKAREVGLNTIHVHCGVHDGGIEGGYPYWSRFSERMGGEPKLREVIGEIHEAGGRMVTFTKDNKVNAGLSEYDETFKKHEIVLRDGGSPRVCYDYGGPVEGFLWLAGAHLANMCRADERWHQMILPEMEATAATGVDGNMIDEWCSGQHICMSKTHGHRKPTDQFRGQLALGQKICDVSLRHNPDYLMSTEETFDASYRFIDVSFTRATWGVHHFEFFRFALPWARRLVEIPEHKYRLLNQAFACGFGFSLQCDGYREAPGKYPEWSAYLREVIRIRGEVRDYLVHGEFRDCLDYGARVSPKRDTVRVKSFVYRGNEVVFVYNEGRDASVRVRIPGKPSRVVVRMPGGENRPAENPADVRFALPADRAVVLEVIRG